VFNWVRGGKGIEGGGKGGAGKLAGVSRIQKKQSHRRVQAEVVLFIV